MLQLYIQYIRLRQSPSSTMSRMGWALRTLLIADGSSCLKDRKVSGKPRILRHYFVCKNLYTNA